MTANQKYQMESAKEMGKRIELVVFYASIYKTPMGRHILRRPFYIQHKRLQLIK